MVRIEVNVQSTIKTSEALRLEDTRTVVLELNMNLLSLSGVHILKGVTEVIEERLC